MTLTLFCIYTEETVSCAVHGTDTEEGVEADVARPLLSQVVSCAVYVLAFPQVPTPYVVHAPSASPQTWSFAGSLARLRMGPVDSI